MNYKEYKIAIVGFYQINGSFNGASEVSLSLYESLNCKKKLFDLKNPKLLDSSPFFNFFYPYLIKPVKILFQIKKVSKACRVVSKIMSNIKMYEN